MRDYYIYTYLLNRLFIGILSALSYFIIRFVFYFGSAICRPMHCCEAAVSGN